MARKRVVKGNEPTRSGPADKGYETYGVPAQPRGHKRWGWAHCGMSFTPEDAIKRVAERIATFSVS